MPSLVGQPHGAPRLAREERVKPTPFGLDDRAVEHDRAAAGCEPGNDPVGVDEPVVAALGEESAVVPVKVALGRQAFREQDVVSVELDVPVGDFGPPLRDESSCR